MTRDDRGAAALELALVLTVLVALLGLVLPLGALFLERLRLGSAAHDAVRFASSRTAVQRTLTTTSPVVRIPAGELPSASVVQQETARAYRGLGTLGGVTSSSTTDSACPSGSRTTVVLTSTVEMGPFAGLLVDGTDTTLTASATSCQE